MPGSYYYFGENAIGLSGTSLFGGLYFSHFWGVHKMIGVPKFTYRGCQITFPPRFDLSKKNFLERKYCTLEGRVQESSLNLPGGGQE